MKSPSVQRFIGNSLADIEARYSSSRDLDTRQLRDYFLERFTPPIQELGFRKQRKLGVFERRFEVGTQRIFVLFSQPFGTLRVGAFVRVGFDRMTALAKEYAAETGASEPGWSSLGGNLGIVKGGSMREWDFLGTADIDEEIPEILELVKSVGGAFFERYTDLTAVHDDLLTRGTGIRLAVFQSTQWQAALASAYVLGNSGRLESTYANGEKLLAGNRQGEIEEFRRLYSWLRTRQDSKDRTKTL